MRISNNVNISMPEGFARVGLIRGGSLVELDGNQNTITKLMMELLYVNDGSGLGATYPTHGIGSGNVLVALGTGTDPYDYNSTDMVNEVLRSQVGSNIETYVDTVDFSGTLKTVATVRYTTEPNAYIGTITEVGLIRPDGGLLAARVLDSPISVVQGDQIVVEYGVAFDTAPYPVDAETGTVSVNSADYDYVTRVSNIYRNLTGQDKIKVCVPGENSSNYLEINGTSVEGDTEVTLVTDYDENGRSVTWSYSALVYASYSGPASINKFGLFRTGASAAGGLKPIAEMLFTPAIPLPSDNKIIIEYDLTLSW